MPPGGGETSRPSDFACARRFPEHVDDDDGGGRQEEETAADTGTVLVWGWCWPPLGGGDPAAVTVVDHDRDVVALLGGEARVRDDDEFAQIVACLLRTSGAKPTIRPTTASSFAVDSSDSTSRSRGGSR